mgnify:CR=1 FL=1
MIDLILMFGGISFLILMKYYCINNISNEDLIEEPVGHAILHNFNSQNNINNVNNVQQIPPRYSEGDSLPKYDEIQTIEVSNNAHTNVTQEE